MPKYDLILLDADGTLFDYDKAEGVALQKLFEYYGFMYDSDIRDRYRLINDHMWKQYEKGNIDKDSLQSRRFNSLWKELGIDVDGSESNSVYLDYLGECGYLLDGALELCKELSKECTLAIATNGISRTQKSRFKNSEILPYISHIIVSEDAGYQKPNIGFFDYAFNICGQKDKNKTIIIGDSLSSDILGGINYGIDTCWYNPIGAKDESGLKIDYEIGDLLELIELISNIRG